MAQLSGMIPRDGAAIMLVLPVPLSGNKTNNQTRDIDMIKKIAGGIAVILAIVLVMAAMQPDSFKVSRSATIKASPDKIAALVDDFHNWGSWSPWEHIDPKLHRTFSGPQSGTGAVYSWQGNSEVGAGRMEITRMAPAQAVEIKLDFLKPFESHNMTEFTLQPQGEQTVLTWNMSGPMPFSSKVMTVFKSMDALIGKDFEKGLANLKEVAEK